MKTAEQIKEEKKNIRKNLMSQRKQLTARQKDCAAADCLSQVLKLREYQESSWIYLYIDCRSELQTKEMISVMLDSGKHVLVPKVDGDVMHFYEIQSLDDCETGAFNILEPKDGLPLREEAGLMLLPGLAFDKDHHRMGYGGGYYDKYLASHDGIYTYALGYDFQLIDEVPSEPHDYVLDGIILGRTRE